MRVVRTIGIVLFIERIGIIIILLRARARIYIYTNTYKYVSFVYDKPSA